MQNMYHLFLIIMGNDPDDILSNLHHIHTDTLQELDRITTAYHDAQDLGDEFNLTDSKIPIASAIIISSTELNKLHNNEKTLTPIKTESVLFLEDKQFVDNQDKDSTSKENYNLLLIDNYKNYLLRNRRLIATSLFQHVKIGAVINSSILPNEFEQVVYAYYKNRSYKKMRSTYLELKKYLPSLVRPASEEQIVPNHSHHRTGK